MERKKKEPVGSFFYFRVRGFTVPELVAVLVITGILAAVAIPRFSMTSSGFDEQRLYDQTLAALRYAQHSAVAKQRTVCAAFTGTSLVLTYVPTYGVTSCVGSVGLAPPGVGTAPFTVVAQGSAGYSPVPAAFTYDRIGRPSAGQTIALIGGRQIVIEAETGYVR